MSDETTKQPSASAVAAEKTAPPLTKTVPAASYSDKNRPHTPGEKKFQRKVHFWLDYIVNSGFSIAWAYTWTEKFGDKLMIGKWNFGFNHCVDKVGQWITKLPGIANDLKTQRQYGKTAMELFGLSVVGWLVLYPIKRFKDKELEHVKKIDAKLDAQRGTPLSPKEQEERAIAYDAIEHRPKQTAKTVLWSRVVGLFGINWIGSTFLLKFISDQANKVDAVKNTGWIKHIDEYFKDIGHAVSHSKVMSSVLKTEGARNKLATTIPLVMLELWGCAWTAIGVKKAMDWGEKHRGKKTEARTLTIPVSGGSTGSTDSVAERKEPAPVIAETTPATSHTAKLVAPAATHREAALREAAGSPSLGV